MLNIRFDSSDQFADRFKNPTPNSLVGQIAEPTLDHVEPGAGSRDKMLMESGVALEPGFDLGMFMSRVVVHDQMQVQVRRGFVINQFQELDPLLMPMAVHACSNDVP